MNILITNDDGIYAEGLLALVRQLERDHDITVVAPSEQRSACGHGITLTRPLTVKQVKLEGIQSKAFHVDGTPADCVRIGVNELMKDRVDLVLSGINRGLNLGTDVIYSGTVSAAIEASIYKVPSIALSMEIRNGIERYDTAAVYAEKILRIAWEKKMEREYVLNVNIPCIPDEQIKGIKVCKIGARIYTNYFIQTIVDEESAAYEIKGEVSGEEREGTDLFFWMQNYVTVTPLHYDLTNFHIIEQVETWF